MRGVLAMIMLLLLGCSSAFAQDVLKDGPFAGVDLSMLPENDALVVKEADEDFLLVVDGYKPKHATFDQNAPLPADGGSTPWDGRQYSLVIIQSASSYGKLQGFIYGPIIVFDKEFAPGNFRQVSTLRFYSREQFRKLKKES